MRVSLLYGRDVDGGWPLLAVNSTRVLRELDDADPPAVEKAPVDVLRDANALVWEGHVTYNALGEDSWLGAWRKATAREVLAWACNVPVFEDAVQEAFVVVVAREAGITATILMRTDDDVDDFPTAPAEAGFWICRRPAGGSWGDWRRLTPDELQRLAEGREP